MQHLEDKAVKKQCCLNTRGSEARMSAVHTHMSYICFFKIKKAKLKPGHIIYCLWMSLLKIASSFTSFFKI